jgi:hypothetical protein
MLSSPYKLRRATQWSRCCYLKYHSCRSTAVTVAEAFVRSPDFYPILQRVQLIERPGVVTIMTSPPPRLIHKLHLECGAPPYMRTFISLQSCCMRLRYNVTQNAMAFVCKGLNGEKVLVFEGFRYQKIKRPRTQYIDVAGVKHVERP